MWGRYHLNNPDEFYTQGPAWSVAPDPGSTIQTGSTIGSTTTQPQDNTPPPASGGIAPYYQLLQLPGDEGQNFSIVRPPRWIGSIDDHVANLQDGVWWGSDDIEHEGHDDRLHAREGATLADIAEWVTARIRGSDDESDEGHGRNQRTAAYALDPVAHILNTPKRVSGMGAWSAASRPNVRMRRVSSGSMTPSSQRRAVAKYGEPSRS